MIDNILDGIRGEIGLEFLFFPFLLIHFCIFFWGWLIQEEGKWIS